MGIGDEVRHAVETLVAWTVRNRKPALIQHTYETGSIAFWRYIATAIQVRRRHQQKRRTLDERPAVSIDERPVFLQNTRDRNPDDLAQFLLGGNDILKVIHRIPNQFWPL